MMRAIMLESKKFPRQRRKELVLLHGKTFYVQAGQTEMHLSTLGFWAPRNVAIWPRGNF
jgi:hypothetical protein